MSIQSQRPTKIFLVRHGQSVWNGHKRISGQLDPPLSAKGSQQAQSLAQVLRSEQLSAIYTSPLTRAIETARPTAEYHQLPIQTKEALKEIHFGMLQGRFRDQRDPEAQRLWEERGKNKGHYRVPGGETFLEVEQRVILCLNEIIETEKGGIVLIVGHRTTNRVILAALLRWSREVSIGLAIKSRYLYEIIPGETPRINTICLDEKRNGLRYAECKT